MSTPQNQIPTQTSTRGEGDTSRQGGNVSNDTVQNALRILAGKDQEPPQGADPEGVDDSNEGTQGQEPPKKQGKSREKPKTLADAAKALGLTDEELFALEYGEGGTDAEGKPVKETLGALKDSHKRRVDFDMEQLAWGEERATQEGELLRSRNELTELMAMLPKSALTPEIREAVRTRHEAVVARERELTLVAIPDWKDENKRGADLAGMRAHLEKSGMPRGYLDRITDHRSLRYIRENYLREQRIERAMAHMREVPKKTPAPSKRGANQSGGKSPTTERRGGNAAFGQQVDAVSKLLGRS